MLLTLACLGTIGFLLGRRFRAPALIACSAATLAAVIVWALISEKTATETAVVALVCLVTLQAAYFVSVALK